MADPMDALHAILHRIAGKLRYFTEAEERELRADIDTMRDSANQPAEVTPAEVTPAGAEDEE